MATLLGMSRQIVTGRRPAMLAVLSLIGLVVLGVMISSLFGAGRAAQLVVTLIVPAAIMFFYWRVAGRRIQACEEVWETSLRLETITGRATGEFLSGISHELVLHPERCSLRAEALAVAVDYRDLCPRLKVAIPDLVVVTDPHLLRQVLHIIVNNALRHGGRRIAIWGAARDHSMVLTVSDDGPGLPAELDTRIFERLVDLGDQVHASGAQSTGLSLAAMLSEILGGRMVYKRDPNWTHFSVHLPQSSAAVMGGAGRMPVQVGVG